MYRSFFFRKSNKTILQTVPCKYISKRITGLGSTATREEHGWAELCIRNDQANIETHE
jgi:predicted ATP-grasp superfamily ATP-dependent carboligase